MSVTRLRKHSDINVSEKTEEEFWYHCQREDWGRILISMSARRLEEFWYHCQREDCGRILISVSARRLEEFWYHCQRENFLAHVYLLKWRHTHWQEWPLAGRLGGERGGRGEGQVKGPSCLRATGWDSPTFSVIITGSISPVTQTGFSSVIGNGRPFPCLGHTKSVIGEGANKSCWLMGWPVVPNWRVRRLRKIL